MAVGHGAMREILRGVRNHEAFLFEAWTAKLNFGTLLISCAALDRCLIVARGSECVDNDNFHYQRSLFHARI
jgi:hypothetical protein